MAPMLTAAIPAPGCPIFADLAARLGDPNLLLAERIPTYAQVLTMAEATRLPRPPAATRPDTTGAKPANTNSTPGKDTDGLTPQERVRKAKADRDAAVAARAKAKLAERQNRADLEKRA